MSKERLLSTSQKKQTVLDLTSPAKRFATGEIAGRAGRAGRPGRLPAGGLMLAGTTQVEETEVVCAERLLSENAAAAASRRRAPVGPVRVGAGFTLGRSRWCSAGQPEGLVWNRQYEVGIGDSPGCGHF